LATYIDLAKMIYVGPKVGPNENLNKKLVFKSAMKFDFIGIL